MGNLWYVREGPTRTFGKPRCELPFSKIRALFSEDKIKFIGTEPPSFPLSKPTLEGFTPPKYVVFELLEAELTGSTPDRIGFKPDIRHGFYLIDVRVEHCEEILDKERL